jgi:hypothetical protein
VEHHGWDYDRGGSRIGGAKRPALHGPSHKLANLVLDANRRPLKYDLANVAVPRFGACDATGDWLGTRRRSTSPVLTRRVWPLRLIADTTQDGSGHSPKSSYNLISAMPAEASNSFVRCAGLSINTTSHVGRICACSRWPPCAVPSRLPTTAWA